MVQWFKDLKVGMKVFLGSSILILLIVIINIVSFLNIIAADNVFENFYQKSYVSTNMVRDVGDILYNVRINMSLSYIEGTNGNWDKAENYISEIDKIVADYKRMWGEYNTYVFTDAQKKAVEDYNEAAKSNAATRLGFYESIKSKNLALSKDAIEKYNRDIVHLFEALAKLMEVQKAYGDQLKVDQDVDKNATMVYLAILFMIAIGIAAVITVVLARSVSNPVRKGLEFSQKFADGDLTARIELDQKDELGQLSKALNKAAEDFEKLITEIIVSSQNLVQAVDEVSAGNQNLSQRTSEQASSLEEIASTIEESSATISQNAENSAKADTLATKASALAIEGGKVVDEAVTSINEINETSKKMSDIISVINEIAFQTNLLALNAAVEAARAGEQGRGFAVVASEVRNLAQRSGSAAKEISELIKDSILKVEKGTALSTQSGEALKNIISSVKEVGKFVTEIAAASNEQKQGSDQITIAVTELDSMTQQNAGLVEETASASEEIANQAQELLGMMEKFRISDSMVEDVSSKKHKEIHLKSVEMKRSSE